MKEYENVKTNKNTREKEILYRGQKNGHKERNDENGRK